MMHCLMRLRALPLRKLWLVRKLWLAGLLAAGCSQNMEEVSSGERIGDSPPPSESAPTRLATPAVFDQAVLPVLDDAEPEVPPFVKAYFMHLWVEALYSVPANQNPNPEWISPLLDPVNGRVWCTDCHVSGQVNFENIPKQRLPMVDQYEQDHEFMADLMRKWVARLNSGEYFAQAKLRQTVTCLTCHATDPAP
jgi:hypothetical protein